MQLIKHLAKEKGKKEKEKRKKPTNLHSICGFQLAQLVKYLMVI